MRESKGVCVQKVRMGVCVYVKCVCARRKVSEREREEERERNLKNFLLAKKFHCARIQSLTKKFKLEVQEVF